MKMIRQETDIQGFPYIAYIPEHISDHPGLLIQLHGAGERGNGGQELDKVPIYGFSTVVNDENFRDCILLMPQCPEDTFWVARIESLKAFIDRMIAQYAIDTRRVFLCGLSMGGYGTWYTAMAYPALFAAILPCCGGGMAWNAQVLTMPIWTFHGLDDDVVSPHQTIEMVESLKACNPRLKYTLLEGVGHDSWNQAFTEETLQWILSQQGK